MEYDIYTPISEHDLHEIIKKNLKLLEKGLYLLDYEKTLPKGIPDFICVDSGGRLVIIEVKLHQDENILFQALRYYGDINKNRYVIANSYKNKTIDPKQNPRIVLIAESFSDDIRDLATLVIPEVELFAYQTIEFENGDKGIVYIPVSRAKVEDIDTTKSPTVEDLYNYLKNDSLKPIVDKIRSEIKSIDKAINEYVTRSYFGYRYKGKTIAFLFLHRQLFDLQAVILDDNGSVIEYSSQRINLPTEDYKDTFRKVKECYEKISSLKR